MKILIADDHWVVRQSLKQVVLLQEKGLEVLEAGTFDEAYACLQLHDDIDLILADLMMPGFEDFAGLQRLRAAFPSIPVVVVSVHDDMEHVAASVQHGVVGYIPKSADGPEMERAFERILAGEVYFPRHILERSIQTSARSAAIASVSSQQNDLGSLTAREQEIFAMLGKGDSIKTIAEQINLTDHTIRVHINRIMKKLDFSDRSKFIHFAVSHANQNNSR
jgi:DNA-binding NarL/FixJ family response regulator